MLLDLLFQLRPERWSRRAIPVAKAIVVICCSASALERISHAMPYCAGFYNGERMPLMQVIRIDGIDL